MSGDWPVSWRGSPPWNAREAVELAVHHSAKIVGPDLHLDGFEVPHFYAIGDVWAELAVEAPRLARELWALLDATGLNPGEIVAVPSELPNPKDWEVELRMKDGLRWVPVADLVPEDGVTPIQRHICRPINKEVGE